MSAKILIVEDEPAIQELLAFNVTQAGFQALHAEDADSAWRQIHSQLPDLILLDWMLPGTSGVALAKQGKTNAAIGPLEAAAKLDRESVQARFYLASVYAAEQRYAAHAAGEAGRQHLEPIAEAQTAVRRDAGDDGAGPGLLA